MQSEGIYDDLLLVIPLLTIKEKALETKKLNAEHTKNFIHIGVLMFKKIMSFTAIF
jgi:hypothetical protein